MNKQEFLEATKDYGIRGLVLAVDAENVKHMHGLIVQARELLKPSKPRVALVCPHCGSFDIVGEGALYWDVNTQSWEPTGAVYQDGVSCSACGAEEITPLKVEIGA